MIFSLLFLSSFIVMSGCSSAWNGASQKHLHLAAAQRPHEFPDGQPQRVYSLASAQANGNREETPVASFQEMEQSLLLDALKRSGGNISKAARLLGVARSTVYKKMRRLGLEIDTAMQ